MVGVNPEVAHETMAGLSFHHAIGQALWAGKLFHIDLNGQRIGRYDQDFRFGAVGVKDAFFLVKLLEDSGYAGPRHFDARALRVESVEGIWDFAAGCMHTYLALREKAARWGADADIRAAEQEAKVGELARETVGEYTPARLEELLSEGHDLDALGARECRNERLDQLAIDLVLGLR
jgi:xylose isomerase